jgi:hypothetical protein
MACGTRKYKSRIGRFRAERKTTLIAQLRFRPVG